MATKKSKQKEPLHQWALLASMVSMGFGALLFMVLVVSQGAQLKTQLTADSQRELIPTETVTPQSSADQPTTGSIVRPSETTPPTSATAPAITPSPDQAAVPVVVETVTPTPVAATPPPTGLPENMILAFALLLGIIGSVTFVILKRGV